MSVACTSFQPTAKGPTPREEVRIASVPGGVVTLRGRPSSDSTLVVSCYAAQVSGRFVEQRGDTTVLRDAYAVSPHSGSSGHCRFRIEGEAFGASGYPSALSARRFSVARTFLMVAAVGAIAIVVAEAEWEYESPRPSGGGCFGFLCLRAAPAAVR